MNTQEYIIAAKTGDTAAFTKLVEGHQNLALGYAYSMLGDFQRAQDVVQEAFIIAFSKLDQLENPLAFPSWLRGIVHHRCHRVFRMNLREWLPIEDFEVKEDENLSDQVQKSQEKQHLLKAIQGLPEQQRTVVTLYYLEEQSQKSVADFLELPVTKVNNYLHEARQHLKGRLLEMAGDTFREQRLSEEFAKNIGEIVSVQGPLVETKVKKSEQTTVFDVLGSKTSADKAGSDLIVVQRLKDGRFRCISTGDEIAEKAKLYHSGQTESAFKELTETKIKEAVDHIVSNGEKPLLETGIKVLDLLCPFRKGGSIGIFGREGVGRAVMVMELLKRKAEIPGDLALFFFVDRWHILGTQDLLDTEFRAELGFSSDVNDNIQTAWIVNDRAGNPNYAKEADYLDARIYFSPLKAIQSLWPCVDPLYSYSNALTEDLVGQNILTLQPELWIALKKLTI